MHPQWNGAFREQRYRAAGRDFHTYIISAICTSRTVPRTTPGGAVAFGLELGHRLPSLGFERDGKRHCAKSALNSSGSFDRRFSSSARASLLSSGERPGPSAPPMNASRAVHPGRGRARRSIPRRWCTGIGRPTPLDSAGADAVDDSVRRPRTTPLARLGRGRAVLRRRGTRRSAALAPCRDPTAPRWRGAGAHRLRVRRLLR